MWRSLLFCVLVSTGLSCNHGMLFGTNSNRLSREFKIKSASQDPARSISNSVPGSTPANPVQVDLYFESECPGCRFFIETQLYPTFYKFKGQDVMTIGLYPYGNARETQNPNGSWNFTCQHGQPECTGNLIEACIIKYLENDDTQFMPVINCIEGSEDPVKSSLLCLMSQSNIGKDKIKKVVQCAAGGEGNQLMHEIAVATGQLNPPHQYVPWVVVNGIHNKTIATRSMTDLTGLVCDLYQGDRPRICLP